MDKIMELLFDFFFTTDEDYEEESIYSVVLFLTAYAILSVICYYIGILLL